jgi:two-component system, chemotaxis family, sensor kinase Cph1
MSPNAQKMSNDPLEKPHALERPHGEDFRQFAYAFSHDLREPLRMVANYGQLLDRRYSAQLDDRGREFVRYIVDGAQQMDRLLTDLLAYSHQFRDPKEPLSQVDSEGALQGVLLNLERMIGESGAQITFDPLPSLRFDFGQLTQLFRQTLSNAIKFRSSEPPRIHVSAVESEDSVCFSVEDNGIGIERRDHDQIFAVCKRVHGSKYPGTGIGLAICKRIVEQHGGKIWVESEIGQGATFRFILPK